jgi:subtilisin family serine protease
MKVFLSGKQFFSTFTALKYMPMNIHCMRRVFAIGLLVLSTMTIQSQEIKPLLLKHGFRVPEANLSTWQTTFDITQEVSFQNRLYKVVVFHSLPDDSIRKTLESAGIRLLAYLPVNAYFVSMPVGIDPQALSGKGIAGITILTPDERLAEAFHEKSLPAYAFRGGDRIEVVVTMFGDVSAEAANERFAFLGWEPVRLTAGGKIAHLILPLGEIYTLAAQPFVQFIEPCDPPAEPDNRRGRPQHRATSAFNPGVGANAYDGTGVRVLINDDGFIGPHIDFQNRIPFQFASNTGQDHGDHCAGTILGAGNRDPLAMGMAPAADLVVYSATNYPGFDSIYNQYNTLGIRLTSTSYSDGCNAGYTNRAATMDEQIRTMPELMHVFSAGNNGTSNCSYGAGSGWGNITGGHKMGKNVIAVANVRHTDTLNSSSSRGPAHDGRIKPDVSALGTNVYSTSENNTYATKTGTSMACPGTAGVLTLMYDAYQRHHSSTPNGGLMKSILMNTADDLGNPGPDFRFGYGRINARRAFQVIQDSLWHTDMVSHGDSVVYSLTVPTGAKELRIMLYWTDYEGVVSSTKALVNDLDLVVSAPDSNWLPWVLNHLPNATTLNHPATRKQDTLNNAEQVTLLNPTPGTYQLKVYGTAVPMGPQLFFINWVVTDQEFLLTYPDAGATWVPGETEVVRWDALPDATGFDLEYTTNNGALWTPIVQGIAAPLRYYEWTVPQIASGNVQVRLTRGTQQHLSAPFTILGVPQPVTTNWVCIDSTKISWASVPQATGYSIHRLGNLYMDSLTFSSTTSAVLHGISHNTPEWFTVKAYGPDFAEGRRATAIFRTPGLQNCIYSFDMTTTQINEPQPVILSGCSTNPPIIVKATVRNNGSAAVSGFSIRYRVNNGAVVSESIMQTLSPGQTLQHTFATPFAVSGPNDYNITVWTQLPNDQFPFNDSMTQMIRVGAFPVLQIPFLETFESFTICTSSNGCALDVCPLQNGWMNPTNNVFDKTDWITNRGTKPSLSTGPTGDHTLNNASGKYLYVEASACFSERAELITPCIDLTTSTLPVLTFWYHMSGASMGSLRLDVLSEGIWHINQMPVIQGNQGTQWLNRMVPLDQFAGKVINLRFVGVIGTNYTSDLCLDDIGVVETVGIDEQTMERSIALIPNPANHRVTVSGIWPENRNVKIDLLTTTGQLLYSRTATAASGLFSSELDLTQTPAGLYLVRISGDGTVQTRKLIIGQ